MVLRSNCATNELCLLIVGLANKIKEDEFEGGF